jgi:putative transposase
VKSSWVDLRELKRLTGWSLRTIHRLSSQGDELTWRYTDRRGRNGKFVREFDVARLPAECRERLLEEELQGPKPEGVKAPSPVAMQRVPVTREQQIEADRRFEVIRPLVELSSAKAAATSFKTAEGRAFQTLDEIAAYLGEKHGCSRASVWRWYSAFKKAGAGALIDKPRRDRGMSRVFARHQEARAFIENKYLNERISIQCTYEALLREWPRLRGREESAAAPSRETVRAHLAALPAPIVCLSREGEKQMNETHRPFMLRDYRTVQVNELWVTDHMQHDVFVYNDCALPGVKPGAPFRPYLTDFMDIRSRKIVGVAWSVNPSSESICSALRVGICQFGVPRAIYTDNGKDYKSRHLSDVLSRLGVEVQVFATKYHAQAKPNESWHATLHKRFDQKMQPAYCGTDSKNTPDECRQALKEHQGFLRGQRKYTPLMAASEFFRTAAYWIVEEYNAVHPHRGQGMGGRSPNEVFDVELPASARRPIDPRHIAELFWKREEYSLREGGSLVINKQRYEPADSESFARLNLLPANERRVLVACDPLNIGEALIYQPATGEYLAMVRASELAAWGPISQAQVSDNKRQQRRFTKALKGYREMLALNRNSRGDLSEKDVLRQRAGLAIGPRTVSADDPMLVDQFRPRRLAAAVGSDLAPHIEDVVDDFFTHPEEQEHGD